MSPGLDRLPVTCLKGVGPQLAQRLAKLGIHWVQDLLFHLPVRYEDRTRVRPLGQAMPGRQILVEGWVELAEVVNRRRRSLICRISDGTGSLNLRFFYFSGRQVAALERGRRIRCFGEVRAGYGAREMVHPEWELCDDAQPVELAAALTPVYPLTEGLQQRTLRRLVAEALQLSEAGPGLGELIPEQVLDALALPGLAQALRFLHTPPADAELVGVDGGANPSQKRLAFEELLAHHFAMRTMSLRSRASEAPPCQGHADRLAAFIAGLPYPLTAAQRRVVGEIQQDMAQARPMQRLVQGDVGSGKTVVAACAALVALAAGLQVVLMAPTELLAEQHYRNFEGWLEPLGVKVAWLTGKHKGKIRQQSLDALAAGETGVVVGTHAVFQDSVRFFRLGLVIIDEQHRFGVQQRLALRDKAAEQGIVPHQLVMTATPIPRTLAMLRFSDLDISLIDEMPPGRTPVKTTVLPVERRPQVIDRIRQWLAAGGQVYWVCTLIEESELLQCQAAEDARALLLESLPEVTVDLVHGRMQAVEKEAVMQAFKQGAVAVLVATTVIEVGVDVPNAGLMIIENAERLGLAQLHQLRGRVGRGGGESFCVLMYQPPLSETARHRLGLLRDSCDGFEIAEKDLELRGAGEVLGTRQTGQIQFKITDLARDKALLPQVRQAAELIRRECPERVPALIQRWLGNSTRYADV